MSPDRRDPFDGIARLIIDGTNVLYALRRSPQPLPAAALIGRLRAVVPPGVSVVLVFDGAPEPGMVMRRIASGVEVYHSGREKADFLIERLALQSPTHADDVLVVTDDVELSFAVRRAGARTTSSRWLGSRLARQRLSAPSAGVPRAPVPPAPSDDDETRRWSPGRGATRKRGNAKRPPKRGGAQG